MVRNIPNRKAPSKPAQSFGADGVFYTFTHGENGPIEIKVDFSQVAEPANYYYADSLRISVDDGQQIAALSFGRREGMTNTFADRIDVAMPLKPLLGPFWTSARSLEEAVDKILEASGITVKLPAMAAPETQAATLFANMIFLSAGDGESTFDFYHMSPRDVHLAKTQRKNIQLHPIVRVIMSSVLTKEFFNKLRPYVESGLRPQPVAEGNKRVARP